jgi:putative transposase
MDWKQLLVSITRSVDQELRLRNEYLASENRLLRNQIKDHVQLSDGDRQALAESGQKLGKQALGEIATIAKPETIFAWYRKFVTRKGDGLKQRKLLDVPALTKSWRPWWCVWLERIAPGVTIGLWGHCTILETR